MISLLVTTGDGDMIETASIGREGAAGLQCGLGERNSYTLATIQIPGEFVTITASRFEQAARDNVATRELISRYIEARWAEAQQIAACNAVHGGSARLCRWLLQAADCIGSNRVPLTQEYLADVLGVRRTTVTLLAQELQRAGAIRYSRGRITIIDRGKLEAGACECYDAIKHENLLLKLGIKF